MYCPSCGEEIPDESEFCRRCGGAIEEEATDQTRSETNQSETEADRAWLEKGKSVIAYLVGAFLILSGLAGLGESPIAALLILMGGVVALPIVRSKLNGTQRVSISQWVAVVIVAGLVLSGATVLGATTQTDPDPSGSSPAGADPSTTENTQSDPGETERELIKTTARASATATPRPHFDHTLNESFVVDGERSAQFVIRDAYTANIINPNGVRAEPEGTFLILIIDMRNTGNEPFNVRSRHLQVVDQDGREFDPDTRTNLDVGYDYRIDAEGFFSEELQPGLTTRRAVVFDVVPNQEYRFKIETVGVFSGADEHYVRLESQELE